jgi:hypothetical protein
MTHDQDEYPDSEDEPLIGCGTCHAVWSDDPEAVPKSVDGRVVVYTNRHGWRLEMGPRRISVWDADGDFVTQWDLSRMTFVEYSEDME